jgi:tRNA pseudouridine32 synthase/23S rRNA pseudouridine746 synthase
MRVTEPEHPDAETAKTRYRTLAATPEAALMELNPETGRMHQLRVHMASLGRPIVGDVRYGGALTVGGHPVPRLMLHAVKLSYPHPDGQTATVEAPMPDDMATLVRALGLAGTNTAGAA